MVGTERAIAGLALDHALITGPLIAAFLQCFTVLARIRLQFAILAVVLDSLALTAKVAFDADSVCHDLILRLLRGFLQWDNPRYRYMLTLERNVVVRDALVAVIVRP